MKDDHHRWGKVSGKEKNQKEAGEMTYTEGRMN